MFQNDLSGLYRNNIVGGDFATQNPLGNVWGQVPQVPYASGPCAYIGNPATCNFQYPGQFASQFPGQYANTIANTGYGLLQPFGFNNIPNIPYGQFGLPVYANTPFTGPFLTHPTVHSGFIGQNFSPFSMSHFNTPWGIQNTPWGVQPPICR